MSLQRFLRLEFSRRQDDTQSHLNLLIFLLCRLLQITEYCVCLCCSSGCMCDVTLQAAVSEWRGDAGMFWCRPFHKESKQDCGVHLPPPVPADSTCTSVSQGLISRGVRGQQLETEGVDAGGFTVKFYSSPHRAADAQTWSSCGHRTPAQTQWSHKLSLKTV